MKALLGVQSHFSFHWGTASPAAWFAHAKRLGYSLLGIADHASLCSLPDVVKASAKSRVRPLYGATFPLANSHETTVYVETADGYGNLCQFATEWQALCARYPLACAGGIPALMQDVACQIFDNKIGHNGLVFFCNDMTLWRLLRDNGAEVYWRLGPTLSSPPAGIDNNETVCFPGPFMLARDDFDTHRLVRAIGGGVTFDRIPEAGMDKQKCDLLVGGPDAWLRNPGEYDQTFAVYAEAMKRADDLAERMSLFVPNQDALHPPRPPGEQTNDVEKSPLEQLRRLAYEGASIRYGTIEPDVRNRLEYELGIIERKGFAEYFLVVHDIVDRLAGGDGRVRRGRSITCGRGSGAASLVNYCLGVTNVDALKHDLMFERFLNVARRDPPDIDVDFAWDERDDIIAKVFSEYGDARVGRVANHNRYDWRGAFRAAARCLGFSDPEITRHMRESPSVYGEPHPGETPIPDAGVAQTSRAVRKLDVLRRPNAPGWNAAERLAKRLVGIPHGISMHCGGIVVAPGLLSRSVPTIMSRKGLPTIQWEKDGAEEMGLVKIDLLGNRSLAVIRDAVKAIAKAGDMAEDKVIPSDPSDDPATQNMVARGDTFGVFYFESPAMRLLLAKARRGDFAHSVIHSSIIRPAANAFITEYIERLRGKPWQPEHPLLAGVFDESYGIPVYQEDVVKLAMALAGYDYARADGLRKCLGKRDAHERLSAAFPELAEAARARGVDEETLKGFWRTLMSMTGYSFCKPHSASYAQVSYEAAYLRAHYPAHFIAAVLSNGGGFYSVQSYVSEAMRLGLRVLGPDVNASRIAWRAEGRGAVRVGLMAVGGLSQAAMRTIESERAEHGRYGDLDDFLRRVPMASDEMRRLIIAGGLDSLAPELNRPQILWHAGSLAGDPAAGGKQKAKICTSGSLFASFDTPTRSEAHILTMTPSGRSYIPELPPYTRQQRFATEYTILGFIPGHHPLAMFEREICESARKYTRCADPVPANAGSLHEHVGKRVRILAWPVTAKVVETKHGDAMMFQSFEDTRAICEAVVFPKEFNSYHRLLSARQPLWVTGRVEEEFDVVTLHVMHVESVLDSAITGGHLPSETQQNTLFLKSGFQSALGSV